jgi:hypothetical protein
MAATTAAVVGIVSGVAGTAMSFAQAAKQQQNIRSAQAKADQAMQEARKKLEVNYYDQLAIQKEPYELQREALLSSGAQAIQAAQEGDRGAAAAAGRVQMAQTEAQSGVRTAMGKELMDLERLSATEESRLRDIGIQLDMGEIAGAQQAMSDAEQAKAAAMAQGFQGIGQTAQAVSSAVPLFTGSAATKAFNRSESAYNKAAAAGTLPEAFKKNGKYVSYQQAAGMVLNDPNLGTMSNLDFTDRLIGRGRGYIEGIDYMNYKGNNFNYDQNRNYAPIPGQGSGVLQSQYYQQPLQQPYEYNPFSFQNQPTAPAPGFNFGKYGE